MLLLILATASLVNANPTVPKKNAFRVKRSLYGHNLKTSAPSPSHEQNTTGGDASNPGFCICDGSESCTKLMPGDTCDSFDMETCTMRQDEGCQWTVTFSVNIGSTEVDFACCGPYDKHPGSDTLFRRSYQEGERFQGKNDDGRICFGCGNSKTITVTPSFDQNIQLPYGTTITCPPVVNKANWLSSETHGDTFGITVAGNKITAQRTDKRDSWGFIKPTEWGIDLKFECTASPTTAAEDAAKKKGAALAECQKMPDAKIFYRGGMHAFHAWPGMHGIPNVNEHPLSPGLSQHVKKASFVAMKKKKNCFKNLAGPRKSAAFQACQKIKPNGKSYDKMKNKKDCFRDLARA